MRVLIVTPTVVAFATGGAGLAELVDLDVPDGSSKLAAFQRIVGGYIEGVSPPEGDWAAYCNEEGKYMGLAPNHPATELAGKLGWQGAGWDVLCGVVVFFGDDGEGNSITVPPHVIDTARTMSILPQEA